MSALRVFSRLAREDRGSAMIEFALLGPAVIIMMLGVLQVGLGLQSYNAMRSASADIARYAMVQYQTGNKLSASQLRTYARNHSQGAPYLLDPDRLGITVEEAASQRVSGAKELTINYTYKITSIVPYVDEYAPSIDYERPIFLLDDTPTPAATPTP